MELVMSIVIGIVYTVSVYLMLSRNIIRVVLGTLTLSHGTHLMLITMSELQRGGPPLLSDSAASYTDPLPQALVLTAIVIAFGVTCMLLAMAYRTYQEHQTVDLEHLRGSADE